MEPKTARTVKWTGIIAGAFILLFALYSARWGGVLKLIQVLACLTLVTAILLQSGKGGGLAALGGMGDQSPFGARSNVALRNVSYFLAGVFLLTILLLVRLSAVQRAEGPAMMPRAQPPMSVPAAAPQKQAGAGTEKAGTGEAAAKTDDKPTPK